MVDPGRETTRRDNLPRRRHRYVSASEKYTDHRRLSLIEQLNIRRSLVVLVRHISVHRSVSIYITPNTREPIRKLYDYASRNGITATPKVPVQLRVTRNILLSRWLSLESNRRGWTAVFWRVPHHLNASLGIRRDDGFSCHGREQRGNGYSRRINQLLAHAFAYGAKKKKRSIHTFVRVYTVSVWRIRRVHKSRWIFDSGDDVRSRRMREICRASSCISNYSINRNPVHVFDMVSRTFFRVFCGFATLLHGPSAYVKIYTSNASLHHVDYDAKYMWYSKYLLLYF